MASRKPGFRELLIERLSGKSHTSSRTRLQSQWNSFCLPLLRVHEDGGRPKSAASATIWAMIRVRPIERSDRPWVARRLEDAFGGVTVARKGVLIDASVLPGFVATDGGRPVGLLAYDAAHGECEMVTIFSLKSTEYAFIIG